jgi:LysR family glycine cleavage system transcriptional activator
LLHDRSTAEWREYIQSFPVTAHINVTSGVVFNETALCLEAAVRGQGVAIGDDFLAELHLSEGRLVKLFETAFPSKNAYYFVVPAGDAVHPAVHAFRTWVFQTVDRVRNKSHS